MKEEAALKKFNQIARDIKSVKIQGAESVALAGLNAYALLPTNDSIKKLMRLRATEPSLANALAYGKEYGVDSARAHFEEAKDTINKNAFRILRKGMRVFTHCHSSTVVDALIYAKKHGRKVEVFNTETRPLLQGRKTARQLAKAGIRVTMSVDSAAREQIEKSDVMIVGADAVLSDGSVINKVGSNMFAEIAHHDFGKKVYVITDAWKFSSKAVKIEERNFREIWKESPRKVKLENPAFEKIEKKYISFIVSELGILTPKEFVKRARKTYPWI